MPDMQFVDSSNVSQIGYEEEYMELHVVFHDGSHYIYQNVPVDIFDQLLMSPSKGSYLNREIKNVYDYVKQ